MKKKQKQFGGFRAFAAGAAAVMLLKQRRA